MKSTAHNITATQTIIPQESSLILPKYPFNPATSIIAFTILLPNEPKYICMASLSLILPAILK